MKLEDIQNIVFEITTYCNAQCPHCPRIDSQGNVTVDLAHLDLDIVLANINKDRLINLKTIVIEGDHGDPVMHPRLLDLIKFFDFVPQITLITNGSIQTESWWQNLAKISNVMVIWSIDGLADTNHLYRVGVLYSRTIKNAQAYIGNGGTAVWKCIIFKHNQHQIQEITDYSKKLGFKSVQFVPALIDRFQPLSKWPVYVNGQIQHSIEPTTLDNTKIYKSSKLHVFKNFLRKFQLITNTKCIWGREGRIYINYLGQVLPCCMVNTESVRNKQEILNLLNNNSLYQTSLENLIDFSLLETALSTNEPAVCVRFCKDQL
jgi:MoaA/NifB/PqqE/SkfB family radical SAM enzyme